MKKVSNSDCSLLDHKTPDELRKRGVTTVQQGESLKVVATVRGINRTPSTTKLLCITAAAVSFLSEATPQKPVSFVLNYSNTQFALSRS
jgi:hypothetical protein